MTTTDTTPEPWEHANTPREHLPYARELVTCLPYAESQLRERLAEAVGEASACWENLAGAGVFESERAVEVLRRITDDVLRLTGMGQPHLGCATKDELLAEVAAMQALEAAAGPLPGSYRTVDND